MVDEIGRFNRGRWEELAEARVSLRLGLSAPQGQELRLWPSDEINAPFD